MDAFFAILFISIILIVLFNRMIDGMPDPDEEIPPKPKVDKAKRKEVRDKTEEAYIRELKKKGYSDELITVILPTLRNDK